MSTVSDGALFLCSSSMIPAGHAARYNNGRFYLLVDGPNEVVRSCSSTARLVPGTVSPSVALNRMIVCISNSAVRRAADLLPCRKSGQ